MLQCELELVARNATFRFPQLIFSGPHHHIHIGACLSQSRVVSVSSRVCVFASVSSVIESVSSCSGSGSVEPVAFSSFNKIFCCTCHAQHVCIIMYMAQYKPVHACSLQPGIPHTYHIVIIP
jgi:hypothetical protein